MATVNVIYKGVSLEVEGTYYQGEPMVMYYSDGSGHPGSPSEFEIDAIIFDGVDVTEIYESLGLIDDIAEISCENYED